MRKSFSLEEARQMAPFVRRILRDVAEQSREVSRWRERLELVADARRSSDFQARRQYYLAQEGLESAERRAAQLDEELGDLGVKLLDAKGGIAGFPFRCQSANRSNTPRSFARRRRLNAWFLLRLSDDPRDDVQTWRLAGDSKDRTIPSYWQNGITTQNT